MNHSVATVWLCRNWQGWHESALLIVVAFGLEWNGKVKYNAKWIAFCNCNWFNLQCNLFFLIRPLLCRHTSTFQPLLYREDWHFWSLDIHILCFSKWKFWLYKVRTSLYTLLYFEKCRTMGVSTWGGETVHEKKRYDGWNRITFEF